MFMDLLAISEEEGRGGLVSDIGLFRFGFKGGALGAGEGSGVRG